MFKQMTMGKKIAGLAAILIVIAGIIAGVGYLGLTNVTDRLEKADDVNRLIKLTQAARQDEKNFIMRQTPEYAQNVFKTIEEIRQQAGKTMDKFEDPENRRQMADVLEAIGSYEKAFSSYLEEMKKVEVSDKEMIAAGRELMTMSETIRQEQKRNSRKPSSAGGS